MNLDGIEPTLTAYQAVILPLNYRFSRVIGFEPILIILEIIVLAFTLYSYRHSTTRTYTSYTQNKYASLYTIRRIWVYWDSNPKPLV
jgi:hypothetical protein